LFDVCSCLDFLAVVAFRLAGLSRKGIGIVVLPALMVLRSKVVLLQALNPARGLSF
jgi:hypothetical protein